MGSERFIYFILYALAKAVGRLHRSIDFRLGKAIGELIFLINDRHRNICITNLKNAYPEKSSAEIMKIASAVFQNLGKILYEVCWSSTLDYSDLRDFIVIEGMRHIRAACAEGKGVLVVTAHFGNWELMPAVGKAIGYPLSIV